MMTDYLSTNCLGDFLVFCCLFSGWVHVTNFGLSRGLAHFAHFLGLNILRKVLSRSKLCTGNSPLLNGLPVRLLHLLIIVLLLIQL